MKLKDLFETQQNQKGLYAAVNFHSETVDNLLAYCERNNIKNSLLPEEFHSTLVYSRKPVPDFSPETVVGAMGKPLKIEVWPSPPNEFKEKQTNCAVLVYESDYMQRRFDHAMSLGATFDYEKYTPHVTLSYDVGDDFDIDSLEDVQTIGDIYITSEYTEELDLNKTFSK